MGRLPPALMGPGTPPVLVDDDYGPRRGKLTTPGSAKTRKKPSAQLPPEREVQEVSSKYRWDVDVGNYYWKRGAGAGGALSVGWGKKGGTSSTPIVVNQMVTVEAEPGRAHLGGGAEGEAANQRKPLAVKRTKTFTGATEGRAGGAAASGIEKVSYAPGEVAMTGQV